MEQPLGSELVHLRCSKCNRTTSLSLESLEKNDRPVCPYCGAVIAVDLEAAARDASRKAHELDETVDSLGSAD
jgi:DNA-directed RNA polymerase subunit RPC12/RpoP